MAEDKLLYNSRIIRTFLEFIDKFYPNLNVNPILKFAGMTKYHINDSGHWFSQTQVDRFYEALVIHTGNPNIARESGRYMTSADGLGAVKQCVLGLVNPMSVYLLMSKLYNMVNHGAIITTNKISPHKVEIISVPKTGVEEKPYQCDNRLGSFESVTKLFTNNFAKIEHPECIHKGGDACRYIIAWENTFFYFVKSIRNYLLLAGIISSLITFFFISHNLWAVSNLLFIIAMMAFFLYTGRLENRDLTNKLEIQGKTAEGTLNETKLRYNNALLIQEIGQATSSILVSRVYIKNVIRILENRSGYDRCLIMLSNQAKTELLYSDSYGYTNKQENILKDTSFHLDNKYSRGPFVVAYKEQKQFLVDDMTKIKNQLSKNSQDFLNQMEGESMICVPIVYEKESLGILAVDNNVSRKPLTQSDINLLMGVASQMAVSIVNARSFQKLQNSERKYRDLVENANSIILRLDVNGNIIFLNDFAQNFFEFFSEKILGKNIVDTILPGFQSIQNELEKLKESSEKKPIKHIVNENSYTKKNGEIAWIAWTYKAIFDDKGVFREVLCIGNDISELKHAEEIKKKLEIRLHRAQKIEALGTLAGGVAHDLNNVLSGIVGYPELILMNLPDQSPLRKSVLAIKKSGEKAAAIVQDLLTLARRGVISKNPINLNKIVTEYMQSPEFAKLKSYHPNVVFKAHLEEDLFCILGSTVHFSKTLMNLVSNAAEAMSDGGEVTISTQNMLITKPIKGYDVIEPGEYVVLAVEDNGSGIKKNDLDRIFEPFYTKKIMGRSGTGLGMAVVWGTIKDHSGKIDIKSIVGKGTKVILYLPKSDIEFSPNETPLKFEDLLGNGEFVLVVDDDFEQREIATSMLETLGYSVASVSSGEEALTFLKNHSVDLLILDMIMGSGMDGYDTYKKIHDLYPSQKAIFTSGFSETLRIKAAQKLGAGVYVKKPYLLDEIGKAIKEELSA